MLKVFANDLDFHRETAAKLMNKAVAEVTADERKVSKVIVFGVTYGMGVETLAQTARMNYGLNWTTDEARTWTARFFDLYPGLRDWRQNLYQQAKTATECHS